MIELVKKLLNELNIEYQEEQEVLFVSHLLNDFPYGIMIEIDESSKQINFISKLPIIFSNDVLSNGYIACNIVNKQLVEGCFYCDTSGEVWFNEGLYYGDSLITKKTLHYVLANINQVMEYIGKKMSLLSRNEITLEAYFDFIFNE